MNWKFTRYAILSLISFVFATDGVIMGADSVPTDADKTPRSGIYAADAVSATSLAEIRAELPGRIKKAEIQLAEAEEQARKELSCVDEFGKERVEKRLMLCGELLIDGQPVTRAAANTFAGGINLAIIPRRRNTSRPWRFSIF